MLVLEAPRTPAPHLVSLRVTGASGGPVGGGPRDPLPPGDVPPPGGVAGSEEDGVRPGGPDLPVVHARIGDVMHITAEFLPPRGERYDRPRVSLDLNGWMRPGSFAWEASAAAGSSPGGLVFNRCWEEPLRVERGAGGLWVCETRRELYPPIYEGSYDYWLYLSVRETRRRETGVPIARLKVIDGAPKEGTDGFRGPAP